MPAYPRPPLPRLQFVGRFFTDPSTVNNDTLHYNNDLFRPNYQLRQDPANPNGLSPEGTGSFSLVNCKVTSVNSSGTVHTDSELPITDPLLSTSIIGNDRSVQAKIVDLDPQNQFSSQIWGLHFNLGTSEMGFRSVMETSTLRDIFPSFPGGQELERLSAVYQNVLCLSEFSSGHSSFLQECAPFVEASKKVLGADGKPLYPQGALSIRFVLNGYSNDFNSEDFRYGTVTGIVQPWLVAEPKQFDTSRILQPAPNVFAMNAYSCVQTDDNGSSSLYVDLANSLARSTVTTFTDIGALNVVALPDGNVEGDLSAATQIGQIDYLSADWLARTGGVTELPITPQQKQLLENTPIAIVSVKNDVSSLVLVEPQSGYFTHADGWVYRLNPDESATCQIYVTKFGKPAAHNKVSVGLDSTGVLVPPLPLIGPPPVVGTPASAMIVNGKTPSDDDPNGFITTLETDAKGVATLTLLGRDPENPRGYIDGQVYGLRYAAGDTLPPLRARVNSSDIISVLLFDGYTIPEKPSWIVDVYPIFKQYANLYPSMDRIVSLDDYGSVVSRLTALERAFAAPTDDPHYMPVTRDLSKAKRDMILKWLGAVDNDGRPLYMNIERVEDLFAALQTAIELEHATIPPYLCALYSIKEGYNQFAADALRDVVIEEMLHFTLVSNILIAIGGRPNINKIGFVPKYPGVLPGGLRRGLIVRLRKCSIEQFKAFMSIEAPERQAVQDGGSVDPDDDIQYNNYTIAFLYDEIKKSLRKLNEDGAIMFPNDCSNGNESDNFKLQVVDGWVGPRRLVKIRSLADALEAIDTIKEQGEGASPTMPSDGEPDPNTRLPDLSHYFRFSEIVHGRRIVVEDDGFSYNGERLSLDEDGIYNMQDDPNVRFLPVGSLGRDRLEAFSKKYQAMLNGLHITFNGQPEYLTQAVALMFQLTISAKPLMEMPALNLDGSEKGDGTTIGISFQVPFSD